MKIFLTGASGYLGGVLMEHFSRMPEVEKISGIGLNRIQRTLPPKATFTRMDMRSPELRQAMAGHDAVVHAACVVLWSASMPARERDDINLNGVRCVAEAARQNGIRRFIHTSSMAAYHPFKAIGQSQVREDFELGDGSSPFYYWNAKAHGEKTLRAMFEGSPTVLTMFRPIYIIGPKNRSYIANYRKNAVNFPGENPRRQFIQEDDVAEAFVRSLREELPGAYNLVPDDFIRIRELWSIVGAKWVPTVPRKVAKAITWMKWRFLGSPIHHSWVEDMRVDFTGSNERLKSVGWKPRYTSAEAVRTAM